MNDIYAYEMGIQGQYAKVSSTVVQGLLRSHYYSAVVRRPLHHRTLASSVVLANQVWYGMRSSIYLAGAGADMPSSPLSPFLLSTALLLPFSVVMAYA